MIKSLTLTVTVSSNEH